MLLHDGSSPALCILGTHTNLSRYHSSFRILRIVHQFPLWSILTINFGGRIHIVLT